MSCALRHEVRLRNILAPRATRLNLNPISGPRDQETTGSGDENDCVRTGVEIVRHVRRFRRNNIAVEGGTVSHYHLSVIRNLIDFMSLLRHSVCFALSFKQFSPAE